MAAVPSQNDFPVHGCFQWHGHWVIWLVLPCRGPTALNVRLKIVPQRTFPSVNVVLEKRIRQLTKIYLFTIIGNEWKFWPLSLKSHIRYYFTCTQCMFKICINKKTLNDLRQTQNNKKKTKFKHGQWKHENSPLLCKRSRFFHSLSQNAFNLILDLMDQRTRKLFIRNDFFPEAFQNPPSPFFSKNVTMKLPVDEITHKISI